MTRMGRPHGTAPRVTIIVRSMGRPSLAEAIASVAAQRHRPLELLVIDATGGTHPALPLAPSLDAMRLVSVGRPLNRPEAANVGMAQATGEWIGFLDDDDFLDPVHVTRLLSRAEAADRPTLVYAQHWSVDRLGRVVDSQHHGFNPLILQFYCLIPGMACLLHRSLRDVALCDESLSICEDWDLWLRLLSHARFATVSEPTHFYHLESGTSGTALARNREDAERHRRYREAVLARHADARRRAWDAHFERLRTGIDLHREGRAAAALGFYARILDELPDEPNALYLMGQVYADLGQLHTARRFFRQSIHYNADAGETHFALGAVCERLGYPDEARDSYVRASRYAPALRETAEKRASALADGTAPVVASSAPGSGAAGSGRNAACFCGSGLRSKACHGSASAAREIGAMASGVANRTLDEAFEAARIGDVETASRALEGVLAICPNDVGALHASALLAWDMADWSLASGRLASAAKLAPGDEQIVQASTRLNVEIYERRIARDVHARLASLPCFAIDDEGAQVAQEASGIVHIVAPFDAVDEPRAMRALELARVLEDSATVRIWSTRCSVPDALAACGVRAISPDIGPLPSMGTLVFIGAQAAPAWLGRFALARVVVTYDHDDAPLLYDLVTAVYRQSARPVHLITPTEALRRRHRMPGVTCLPWLDLECLHPRVGPRPARPFTVGRASRNDVQRFHPGDAMLFRRLAREGVAVRVLGGTVLMRNFPPSHRHRGVELLSYGEQDPADFLRTLDCLLYRTSPRHETVGRVIAEALACGIPVVCARQAGLADLVSHGSEGFLFDADADHDALRYVRLLHRNPSLCERMGIAARARAEALFGAQHALQMRRAFLGAVSSVRDAGSNRARSASQAS